MVPSRWWTLLKQYLIIPALDLVFPPVCIGCGRVGKSICDSCLASLASATTTPSIAPPPHPLQALFALGIFEGVLRQAIHDLKYEGQTGLATPLADILSKKLTQANWMPGVIVPVPLHHKRQEQRGYNQAAVLGACLSNALGWPIDTQSLIRIRSTASQVGLNRQSRQENVRAAFSVSPPDAFQNRDIILIDDVFTTGATLRECAEAVQHSGARSIRAAVIGQASVESRASQ